MQNLEKLSLFFLFFSTLSFSLNGDQNFSINLLWEFSIIIWVALRDLVPFAQLKKRENNPWRGVTFSNVAGNF